MVLDRDEKGGWGREREQAMSSKLRGRWFAVQANQCLFTENQMKTKRASDQTWSEPDSKRFLSVSKYILTICDSECEAEAFYISKALCEKLNVSEAVINEHVAFYTKTLALQKELNK